MKVTEKVGRGREKGQWQEEREERGSQGEALTALSAAAAKEF
jgi:hypothetical protein